MLDEIKQKIEDEIEDLSRELHFDLPDRIGKAVALGDLRENSEYKAALERQQFVQARIGHLTRRVSELSQIDVEGMPPDRVGFGSRVTVHDYTLGEDMTFTIVVGDYIDLDGGYVSMASPIGQGLMGAHQDEEVVVALPAGERKYKVVELQTLPQQLDVSG